MMHSAEALSASRDYPDDLRSFRRALPRGPALGYQRPALLSLLIQGLKRDEGCETSAIHG